MRSTLAAAGLLLTAAAAQAIGPEVIYTKIPGHPTSAIPGARDLAGNPAASDFRALEDLIFAPDGSRWIVKGRTQLGSDLENIMLAGSGTSGNAFAQEGQPILGGGAGELYDFFGSGIGRFDENGNFAYSARARGGSTLQKVIVWNGAGTFLNPFNQGDLYTGLIDLAPNPSGDETVGNSVGSIHLLNNGTIGSQDSSILQIHTSRRPAITYNRAAFHQTNVTQVVGLNGGPMETWKIISANTFYTSPDGAHWLAIGQVNQATTMDAVLVYDGQVVIQEGVTFPGTSATVPSTIVTADILTNGDYIARGALASGGVYAARNGVIVAATGATVDGAAEAWGSTFLAFAANRLGHWALVGTTDNPDPARDTVLMVNNSGGATVLLREGDPVDLDNNGLYDDDVFIGRGNNTLSAFEANDLFLADNGDVYFFANLRDGAGNDLNSNPAFGSPQAFLRIVASCPGDANGDRVVNFADLNIVLSFFGQTVTPGTNGDVNGDGVVNFADLNTVLSFFGTAC